jgi:hypothetical protein
MIMYTSIKPPTSLISPDPSSAVTTTCYRVPYIRLLRDLLSLEECRAIITAAESLGFTPDEPVWANTVSSTSVESGSRGSGGSSVLAHNVFWHADPEFMEMLEKRVMHLLPPTMIEEHEDEEGKEAANGTSTATSAAPALATPSTTSASTIGPSTSSSSKLRYLAGLNPRFRVYRYTNSSIYRPHIDGAWPPSEYVEVTDPQTGEWNEEDSYYIHDASDGKTWSKLTFLMYLNEGFEGGHTTYFIPTPKSSFSGHAEGGSEMMQMDGLLLDARSIKPRAGCAMVFLH